MAFPIRFKGSLLEKNALLFIQNTLRIWTFYHICFFSIIFLDWIKILKKFHFFKFTFFYREFRKVTFIFRCFLPLFNLGLFNLQIWAQNSKVYLRFLYWRIHTPRVTFRFLGLLFDNNILFKNGTGVLLKLQVVINAVVVIFLFWRVLITVLIFNWVLDDLALLLAPDQVFLGTIDLSLRLYFKFF